MTVIYRCTDRKGQALYIGASRSLPQRLNRHRTEAIWWPLVADVQIVSEHEDRQEAFAAEFAAIRSEQPRYNDLACSSDAVPHGADRPFLRRAWSASKPTRSGRREHFLFLLGVTEPA